MKYANLFFLPFFILLIGCQIAQPISDNDNSDQTEYQFDQTSFENQVTDIFSSRYGFQAEDIVLSISVQKNNKVKGTVQFNPNPGTNDFIAIEKDDIWSIVWDGGPIYCQKLLDHDIPEEFWPDCTRLDSDNQELLATLTSLMATKHNITPDQVELYLAGIQTDHVIGSVKIGGGGLGGAGNFLASDALGVWEIVWDGNGTYTCQQVAPYNFPPDMISHCYDENIDVVDDNNDESTSDKINSLKQAFATKYNKNATDANVTIQQESGHYVQGGIIFNGEISGAMFFATDTSGSWEIVWDGNGTFECSLLSSYGFPASMQTGCI